ncbi:putative quinol monooxygenase [Propionicimonas sp.]|uniref:putative quinol monooxygenase n=1 Tax=Propionicimonas sp. TaxID=1955623 RepID=UPI0017954D5C|nr:antibiotic biosynthesis monooxygenase family protein [Propionicimonas sp.]MBU3977612.1 antibiotic biosynthesis monooxygenase [Actinomycetota bacterium]MBA3021537.1 antibiotic biosynthesis monooxygenase [Propionicimonas sp.]MBU3987086.1 antibiotic biosynthesis monooxygenase [Actinomycetota bacterium]MBU4008907.1 antibiotic biosynthesis monooxygenase [Actinomycetota bacterium]MBU4065943.1 antibiotic biosynthesis monooxygenase [Actinomycetota bacterium]
MSEVNLIATMIVAAEVRTQISQLLGDYGRQVRTEPGNLRFESYLDRDRGALVVVERYRDEAAFNDHLARPENAVFNARLGEISGGESVLQMLEALN